MVVSQHRVGSCVVGLGTEPSWSIYPVWILLLTVRTAPYLPNWWNIKGHTFSGPFCLSQDGQLCNRWASSSCGVPQWRHWFLQALWSEQQHIQLCHLDFYLCRSRKEHPLLPKAQVLLGDCPLLSLLSLRAGCGWKGPVQKMPRKVSLSVYRSYCKVLPLQQDNSRGWSVEAELTKDLSFVTLVLFIQVGSAVHTLLAVRWIHDFEITCCIR